MINYTEEQKNKILENFKKVIKHKDPSLISEDLYNHLNINCNFNSHFGHEGFINNYSGDQGFFDFLQRFDRNSPLSDWVNAPEISKNFESLNNEIINYSTENAPVESRPDSIS